MFRAFSRFAESQSWLDTLGEPLQNRLKDVFGQGAAAKQIQNMLNGTWLGHPLHPVLTDVPIGSWTATEVLDVLNSVRDDDSLAEAADITLVLGLAGAAISLVTGITQWNDTYAKDRRVGLLHGLTMTASFALYSGSLAARLQQARKLGMVLSHTGYAVMSAGAYLGGEEVYDIGYGVNHTAFQEGPGEYVAVLPEADLRTNEPVQVDAQGTPVLLIKLESGIYAMGDTCTHAGCSLAGGKIDGLSIICPCHGSQFDLRDGEVVNGPATYPEPKYYVRLRDGNVEVKRSRP